MSNLEKKAVKITFFQKKKTVCPICRYEFTKEELFTGRGRLIAGDLNNELRREYQENKKFGKIIPLIYNLTVCPQCFYSTFSDDFNIPVKQCQMNLQNNIGERTGRIKEIFPNINFEVNRTLEHGVASYILAISCYSFFDKKYAPSFKRAISSIRTAWLLNDLMETTEDEKFGYMRDIFYRKATYFYTHSLEVAQNGQEIFESVKNFGPDIDKNFGYDGLIYMASLLKYNAGSSEEDLEKRALSHIKSKRLVSKLVGLGKASKDKPIAILDKARDLYEQINSELKELEKKLGKKFD